MNIQLDVTQSNGVFDVTFTPISTPPPAVEVSLHRILIDTSQIQVGGETFSFTFELPPEYRFVPDVPPILWAAPPGALGSRPVGTSFGQVVVNTDRTACTLPVTVQPGSSSPEAQFFFFIKEVDQLLAFVVDPTIVTDPDPG